MQYICGSLTSLQYAGYPPQHWVTQQQSICNHNENYVYELNCHQDQWGIQSLKWSQNVNINTNVSKTQKCVWHFQNGTDYRFAE